MLIKFGVAMGYLSGILFSLYFIGLGTNATVQGNIVKRSGIERLTTDTATCYTVERDKKLRITYCDLFENGRGVDLIDYSNIKDRFLYAYVLEDDQEEDIIASSDNKKFIVRRNSKLGKAKEDEYQEVVDTFDGKKKRR